MRPATLSAFIGVLVVLALLPAGRVGAQQCQITGPSALCDGSAQLCAPSGEFMYEWSGPGFFFSTDRCITVTTPGTYMLSMFDMINGLEFGPCMHDLSVAPTVTATIDGPSSVCGSSLASLCGPAGNLGYAWSGPGGFTATSQCVSVSTEGTYSLVVTDLPSGCSSAPAEHALAVTAAPSASISGTSQVCAGSTAELCGPAGNLGYAWSGPGGFAATSQCVSAGVSGTYSLVVTNLASGCPSAPASQDVTVSPQPVAEIVGPTEVCPGGAIELCGPDGNLAYEWSGPEGFAATTACASAGLPGLYRLIVRDVGSGCTSAPAEHAVGLAQCRSLVNCPLPASFWTRECRTGSGQSIGGDHVQHLPDGQLSRIATSVDDHAAFFDWSNDRDGFCIVMHAIPRTLPARAARQFAAMLANACAGDMGLAQFPNRATALTLDTQIELPEASMTVGQWLAATDAALASLAQRSPRDHSVKAAYRRIISVGWHVNHGLGIGPVCGHGGSGGGNVSNPGSRTTPTLSTEVDPNSMLLDPEPLAVELADEGQSSLLFASIHPNPFAINARVGFTVVSTIDENVSIGIYDLSGRLVHELVQGSFAPGAYEVRWDGRDDRGGVARNGMYFVLGRVNGGQVQSRVSLLR